MAIYYLSLSNMHRSAGSSSVAAASYITAERMHDERRGVTWSGFGRRERVLWHETLLPDGAPAEYADPERLFNAIEAREKRADASTAVKIVVALPRELDAAGRRAALGRFIRRELLANGYAALVAVHEDKDGNNPHAHILVANRRIDPKTGNWVKSKQKTTFALDENGQRIPIIDPATGRQKVDSRNRKKWRRVTVSSNPLDRRDFLLEMREAWADVCNELLPEGVRIDHRTLEEQGIDRIPTIHEGYAAREMERRGQPSDRMAINREIRAANRVLEDGDASIDALRAHQSELRRLLHNMAVRAAQAFDRMLESIGRGVDPSDAVETMWRRDGISLTVPRNTEDADQPIWRAWLYDRQEWAVIPSRVLRDGMRTVGRVRAAIGSALRRWRDAQPAGHDRADRPAPLETRTDGTADQAHEDTRQSKRQSVSLADAAREARAASRRLEQTTTPVDEPPAVMDPFSRPGRGFSR